MTSPRWLVGRQPVLDRVGRVWGYELLFRSADGTGLPGDASFATANVLLGTVAGIGTREVLGGKPALVNVGQELLFSDALELLPRNLIVLEVLESVTPSRSVVQRCRALKAAGFSIALDDQLYDAAWDDLYALADLVKVDVMAGDEVTVASAVERLRRFPAALLAEKVETPDAYRRCLDLGFHYFQGYHFARPAVVGRRKLGEDGTLLLDLLRRLNAGAEVPELEETFRRSPGLTFKLLVLVNSVSVGVRERIGSIRQAITMLGRDQLRRWLQLALFATDEQRGLDDPLVELAAVRAALMEKLATGLAWPAVEASRASSRGWRGCSRSSTPSSSSRWPTSSATSASPSPWRSRCSSARAAGPAPARGRGLRAPGRRRGARAHAHAGLRGRERPRGAAGGVRVERGGGGVGATLASPSDTPHTARRRRP
ncbi:MAG: EAL domain-containing protein [Anaeromyxobacter sp.]